MKRKAVLQLCCFLCFVGLAFGYQISDVAPQQFGSPVPSPDIQGLQKMFVRIVNNLSNKDLIVHCRSKDDDLGFHTLHSQGEQYEFGFRFSLFGNTLFWCNLWYLKHHVVFDAFKVDKSFDPDKQCGGAHCIWKAQEDGIYLYNIKKKLDVKKHKWDEKPPKTMI